MVKCALFVVREVYVAPTRRERDQHTHCWASFGIYWIFSERKKCFFLPWQQNKIHFLYFSKKKQFCGGILYFFFNLVPVKTVGITEKEMVGKVVEHYETHRFAHDTFS